VGAAQKTLQITPKNVGSDSDRDSEFPFVNAVPSTLTVPSAPLARCSHVGETRSVDGEVRGPISSYFYIFSQHSFIRLPPAIIAKVGPVTVGSRSAEGIPIAG
jgi:hypothetical protein